MPSQKDGRMARSGGCELQSAFYRQCQALKTSSSLTQPHLAPQWCFRRIHYNLWTLSASMAHPKRHIDVNNMPGFSKYLISWYKAFHQSKLIKNNSNCSPSPNGTGLSGNQLLNSPHNTTYTQTQIPNIPTPTWKPFLCAGRNKQSPTICTYMLVYIYIYVM